MYTKDKKTASYDFGNWGVYPEREQRADIFPGFTAFPPGANASGEYDLIYAASFKISGDNANKNVIFQELVDGCLSISKCVKPFISRVEPTRQNENLRVRVICQETILSCKIVMHDTLIGYPELYGLDSRSEAAQIYNHRPNNASLIANHNHSIIGRLYTVSERKPFCSLEGVQVAVHREKTFESQEAEVREAERICSSRHWSFLCQDLDLPCGAASLITRYADESPPFIFAEPGDIWIDFNSSDIVRTYLLARRQR